MTETEEALRLLGVKIRKMREKRGWSQEHLAELSYLSRGTIEATEHGKRSLTLRRFWQIAKAFGTTGSKLLSGIDPQ